MLIMGSGGSSSGSTSDYGTRGPGFDSRQELGFFLFSFLSLNQWRVLNQVPHEGETQLIFQISLEKTGGLAVQLEAKQAY